MKDQAEEIFSKSARKDRPLNLLVKQYDDAKRLMRDTEVLSSKLKQIEERLLNAHQRFEDSRLQRQQNDSELAKLARLRQAQPIVHKIDMALKEANQFENLPTVYDGFVARLSQMLDEFDQAARSVEDAQDAHKQALAAHREVAVDQALLAKGADIAQLVNGVTAYLDALRDQPRIAAEQDGYASKLIELARRIGLPDPALLETQQPTDAAAARVRSLIGEGRDLSQQIGSNTRTLQTEVAAEENLKQQQSGDSTVLDPGRLQGNLDSIASIITKADRRDEVVRAFQAEKKAIAEAAARLKPTVLDAHLFAFRSIDCGFCE
jgi:hypothetical protein